MNQDTIYNDIEKLRLDNAYCQRVLEINITPVANGTKICAYQCNMAKLNETVLKLPTCIEISLTSEGIVKDVHLLDNFKGSQGASCSFPHLNTVLQSNLINRSFLNDEEILKQKKVCQCTHIYEITAAVVTFYRHCKDNLDESNVIHEETKAFSRDFGFDCSEKYRINDYIFEAEQKFSYDTAQLTVNESGKTFDIKQAEFEVVINNKMNEKKHYIDRIASINGSQESSLGLLRLFVKQWKIISKMLGVTQPFYFSNLVPTSFYGIFTQALILRIFPNNHDYFQYAIKQLQHSQGVPLCIGMTGR